MLWPKLLQLTMNSSTPHRELVGAVAGVLAAHLTFSEEVLQVSSDVELLTEAIRSRSFSCFQIKRLKEG